MKYRLKKDLPFAKAGTYNTHFIKARISGSHGLALFIEKNGIKKEVYIGKIKDLIPDWIEEVKPREFYVNTGTIEASLCNNYYAYPLEIFEGMDLKGYIKVREVIE